MNILKEKFPCHVKFSGWENCTVGFFRNKGVCVYQRKKTGGHVPKIWINADCRYIAGSRADKAGYWGDWPFFLWGTKHICPHPHPHPHLLILFILKQVITVKHNYILSIKSSCIYGFFWSSHALILFSWYTFVTYSSA